MLNRLPTVFLLVFSCGIAFAQNLCPTGVRSDKLICLLPQVYGIDGLVLTNSGSQFQNDFLTSSLRPLNSALARQSALLPLPSPSSGITFTMDPVSKLPIPSVDSLGPIMNDRAETIGKHRVFLGLSYQYLKFNSLDGVDLKALPVVFAQPDQTVNGIACSTTGNNTGQTCGFIRDVIKTTNRLDLKIHQTITSISFGLTNQIDVSAIIPIDNVRMAIVSDATIVNNSLSGVHSFQRVAGCGTTFPSLTPCLTQVFSSVRNVSGIGDITLRVKGTAWKNEETGLALGLDVRVPTGDALNFIGAGAAGIKPFVVLSRRSRISTHVLIGYEINGSSVLAGDITSGSKEKLPSQLTYSGGADIWATKWLTAAIDLVGQQVFESRRTSVTTFPELGACLDRFCGVCPTGVTCSTTFAPGNVDHNLSQMTGTYNISSLSLGVKLKPISTLLLTGNVLVKLNDGGPRATAIPLIGVSYSF